MVGFLASVSTGKWIACPVYVVLYPELTLPWVYTSVLGSYILCVFEI